MREAAGRRIGSIRGRLRCGCALLFVVFGEVIVPRLRLARVVYRVHYNTVIYLILGSQGISLHDEGLVQEEKSRNVKR